MLNYIFKIVVSSIVFALLSLLLVQVAFSQNNQAGNKAMYKIPPAQFAEIIERHKDDPRFFILDVRTLAEYEQGHIAGSKLLDSASPLLDKQLLELEPNATYLVYCRSGRRSAEVAEKMEKMGFFLVYDLEGGLVEWTKQGFAIQK